MDINSFANPVNNVILGLSSLPPVQPEAEAYSQLQLATTFANSNHKRFKYCFELKKWLKFNGKIWEPYNGLVAHELGDFISRTVSAAQSLSNAQRRSTNSYSFLTGVENICQGKTSLQASINDCDHDPMLLNTPSCIIDLGTGDKIPHDQKYMMMKTTSVSSEEGYCNRWLKLLEFITNGDEIFQQYLEGFLGYCLSGRIDLGQFIFLYGFGANGKSLLMRLMLYILNDYATTAMPNQFLVANNADHPTQDARLVGVRCCIAEEMDGDVFWNEPKIKNITGGMPLTARALYKEPFTFQPQLKLVFIGNKQPALKNAGSEALERRLRLIPFDKTVPAKERNPRLLEMLKEEAPAILHRLIKAGTEFHKNLPLDLNDAPVAIAVATRNYLASEDSVRAFIKESCEESKSEPILLKEFMSEYEKYTSDNGSQSLTKRSITQRLRQLKYLSNDRRAKGYYLSGLAWKPEKANELNKSLMALSYGNN